MIFADRFLYANREMAKSLRDRESTLKQKIKALEDALDSFENHNKTGLSLEDTLKNTLQFLES
jgi:BMFP domain-containing protein YqiC